MVDTPMLNGTPLFQMFQPPPRLSRSPPRLLPPLPHSSARRPRVCSLTPPTATSSSTATMDTLTSRTAPPTCTSTPRWWYDTSSPRLFFVNLNEHQNLYYVGTVAGRSKWTHYALHTVQNLVRVLNSAHVQPGPGYPSALVSLERMLFRLTPTRGGTAYHSRHVPTG